MRKSLRLIAVIGLLLSLFCYMSVNAGFKQGDDALANKIKASIAKLGTGFDARVEVKLDDKTKLRGYVSEVHNDYFIVVNDETHLPTQVQYSQVQKVKGKSHRNEMNNRDKLERVAGVGLFVWFVVAIAVGYSNYP